MQRPDSDRNLEVLELRSYNISHFDRMQSCDAGAAGQGFTVEWYQGEFEAKTLDCHVVGPCQYDQSVRGIASRYRLQPG